MNVQPCIFMDAKEDLTTENEEKLKGVVSKIFHCPNHSEKEAKQILTDFMEQFHSFHQKQGWFDDETMWNSPCSRNGQSHIWHQMHSCKHHWYLCHAACRINSKPTGMGKNERWWSCNKDLLDGKRVSLSSERMQKATILHGAACIEKSRVKLSAMDEHEHHWGPLDLVDDDFNKELDSFHTSESEAGQDIDCKKAPTAKAWFESKSRKKVFKAWLEDWESEHIHNKSADSQHCLLEKHCDMCAFDPEDGGAFHQVCKHKLQWVNEKGNKKKNVTACKGWAAILLPKGEEFSSDQIANYISMGFDSDHIHSCIGICQQKDSCAVLKQGDVPVNDEGDCIQFFNECFQGDLQSEKHFREWDSCK